MWRSGTNQLSLLCGPPADSELSSLWDLKSSQKPRASRRLSHDTYMWGGRKTDYIFRKCLTSDQWLQLTVGLQCWTFTQTVRVIKTTHTAQCAHQVNLRVNNSNQIAKTLVNQKYPFNLEYRTLRWQKTFFIYGVQRWFFFFKKNKARRNNLANVKHWLPSPVSDPFKNNLF